VPVAAQARSPPVAAQPRSSRQSPPSPGRVRHSSPSSFASVRLRPPLREGPREGRSTSVPAPWPCTSSRRGRVRRRSWTRASLRGRAAASLVRRREDTGTTQMEVPCWRRRATPWRRRDPSRGSWRAGARSRKGGRARQLEGRRTRATARGRARAVGRAARAAGRADSGGRRI